jgi:hypothetical protein
MAHKNTFERLACLKQRGLGYRPRKVVHVIAAELHGLAQVGVRFQRPRSMQKAIYKLAVCDKTVAIPVHARKHEVCFRQRQGSAHPLQPPP